MCHLSIIQHSPRPESNLHFQVLKQVSHCCLIPVLLFFSLSEAPREAQVPEATGLPSAVSSQQNSGRYVTSIGSRHSIAMGERTLQNVNKSVYFKQSLLNTEMHKLR